MIKEYKLLLGLLIGLTLLAFSCMVNTSGKAVSDGMPIQKDSLGIISWKGAWIMAQDQVDTVNAWTVFEKDFELEEAPVNPVIARIAVDSKYWLWINGERVVFEGGLKRGPAPDAIYFDELDIQKYLKKGQNQLRILHWYFGKEGFSHKSSGKGALLFEILGSNAELNIVSDESWKAWKHPSFGQISDPHPNFRLPESNILFDARKGSLDWEGLKADKVSGNKAIVVGEAGKAPWGKLIKRLIPQWKDFGLKSYSTELTFPFVSKGDTLKLALPYNAQITPYLKVEASAGKNLEIRTDHFRGGGPPNVRAEYVTQEGVQEYESLGWMNGHEVHYYIPEGVKVLDLKYRETGYNTGFEGAFFCDAPFFNKLWEKSLRTLYITMRDTYMDCPDRERAQWWGDVVLESGESFYALSPSSHLLTKKGMIELVGWQRPDSTLFAPIPAGNWINELPTQMLSSIGKYGFWNYYWHTGDKETINKVYPAVGRYLGIWKLNDKGTLITRKGGWTWGDWGQNRDMELLFNTQYYMALESYKEMAHLLGDVEVEIRVQQQMDQFKAAFNKAFWNGKAYRSPIYKGKTDDRSQGLAVVAGLADISQYEAIYKVLLEEKHASPYMEKYVLEALFQMGYPEYALERMQERFGKMVNHPEITTLWEGWGIGAEGFGGGTTNHAWSGGGLTLLSQYVAGIYPLEAGYERFQVKPQLGFLSHVKATVPSVKGKISVQIDQAEEFQMELNVPEGTTAKVFVPNTYGKPNVDDKVISMLEEDKYWVLEVEEGLHRIVTD